MLGLCTLLTHLLVNTGVVWQGIQPALFEGIQRNTQAGRFTHRQTQRTNHMKHMLKHESLFQIFK